MIGNDSHYDDRHRAAQFRAARTVPLRSPDSAGQRDGLPLLLLLSVLIFLLFLLRPASAYAADLHCGSDFELELQMRPLPPDGLQMDAPAFGKAGNTDIVLNAGPGLNARPQALAAWNAAVAIWEAVLDDPIQVQIQGEFAALGSGILGSTQPTAFSSAYATIRNAMVSDAASNESIVNSLPTTAQKQLALPPGFIDSGSVVATKANLKALGFNMSFNSDPDAAITFSTGFENQFDYDPADGIAPGKYDFVAIVVHEIGHALGFASEVDAVDYYRSNSQTSVVYPRTLDLFRLLPGGSANFATSSRCLKSGDLEPAQIFFDGSVEHAMSTGVALGDGRQASHWKADELSGIYLGIMDPTLSPARHVEMTANDVRAMGLIGWNVLPLNTSTPAPEWRGRQLALFAHPNPFNPSTSITVHLSAAGAANVELFNAAGQRLRSLYRGELAAGDHLLSWDGRDESGRRMASGIYFVRAQAKESRAVLKLVLVQ